MNQYPTVVVFDFPWPSPPQLKGQSHAGAHYELMSFDEIAMYLAVHTLDFDNCVVFCWRIAMFQAEVYPILHEAGLKAKDELVWDKVTKHGKMHYGQGRYTKKSHETCVIAVRGKGCLPHGTYVRSRFEALVREHSRKPDEFFQIVETMYPKSRKIEHFGRWDEKIGKRPGWEVHGSPITVK